MRYADCPTVDVEIHVDAPPARVWSLVSDIQLSARFSSEFQGATWLGSVTDSTASAGARFVGHNRHPAIGDWETESVVVEYDPERRFGWAVGDPDHPSATWRFELEAEGRGTRLRQRAQMGPAPSGLTIAIEAMPEKEERIVARRLKEWRSNMLANLEGIKALAEGAEGGAA